MSNVNPEPANNKKGLSNFVNEDVFELNKFEDPISQAPGKPKRKFLSRMKDALFLFIGIRDFAGQEVDKSQADQSTRVEADPPILKRGFEKLKDKVRKKAFKFPWVVISISLAVGFLMIRLIKPTRKVLKVLK
jgi:hypothetical protein